MCGKKTIYQTSDRWNEDQTSSANSIGDLFRQYGEVYIDSYKPDLQKIKLIRSIRICKSPALGGMCYTCKDCGSKHYIYKSCGNSQCMLCQSIKREQWMDKLSSKLLKVPYVHCIFTIPHQLNGLAKANPNIMYSILLKASWNTIQKVFKSQQATPGMTSVLHTFGSDLKYHVHTHALVTFGGLNKQGCWIYPENPKRLCRYRQICADFKTCFLKELQKAYDGNQITYHLSHGEVANMVNNLRWVVHTTHPTMDPRLITQYLGRYINRVAVSQSRVKFVKENKEVLIQYNDYKNQKSGEVAPKAIKHLEPLVAIDQILVHVLPSYFQKSRNYGIHNASNKTKHLAQESIKNNSYTIRTVFQIVSHLLGLMKIECKICGKDNLTPSEIIPDKAYIFQFIKQSNKSPPQSFKYRSKHLSYPMGMSNTFVQSQHN